MRLDMQRTDAELTVRFSGQLTFSDNGQFRKVLDEIRSTGVKRCIIDLAGLSAIDSAGLGMLMIAVEDSKKNSWTLKIVNSTGGVKQLLHLSKINTLIEVE